MAKKTQEQTFEAQLAQLEALVEKMEEGGLTLEEMLKAYEEGTGLGQRLQNILEETKGKLTMVKTQNGKQVEVPLEDKE